MKEFLEDMKERYELIIYTAADADYADSILDCIEHKFGKCFAYRLYADQCVTLSGTCLFKCLNFFSKGRDAKDIVIVDNTVRNFALSLKNGIPIKAFRGDDSDTELVRLAKYMRVLAEEEKMPARIEKDFSSYLSNRSINK